MKILFLAKDRPYVQKAVDILKNDYPSTKVFIGTNGEPFPNVLEERFDYVISYLSPWIVPKQVLDNTRKSAINFHTGDEWYPGIGCVNFAFYSGAVEYGICVHIMEETVDTGDIIMVKRFPVAKTDTVYSVTQRCYVKIFEAFVELYKLMKLEKPLPRCSFAWGKKPYRRKELNELCILRRWMCLDEIRRRRKAMEYPNMPGAHFVY